MEMRTMVLGHFLVISLALNVGLLCRDYCWNGSNDNNTKYKSEDVINNWSNLGFKNRSNGDGNHAQKRGLLSDDDDDETSTLDQFTIDLDHGDPTMYEKYWQQLGDKTTVVIPGWKFISYFSDVKNLCWFLEPEFADAVIRLHKVVGNAVTRDRHIVIGTGSTQLIQAVLYAISQPNASEPINVVSTAPFYSSYPLITEFLKSGLYTWAGDARQFKEDKRYVELVTSPNNPDGETREAMVNRKNGILIHDFAYYWPQYVPISSPADKDIMLFTVSKSTGHAGSRLGWALVKDQEIARKMTEFIVLSTIGVSKESQLRAAKILQVLADTHEYGDTYKDGLAFFDHSHGIMARRWQKLRDVVKKNGIFSLPKLPSAKCKFSGRTFTSQPAFAWLKCEGETDDCEGFLRRYGIIARSGKHFGDSEKFVRISILPQDKVFEKFIQRLESISSS